MSLLSYDRYQREIVRQSGLLSSVLASADLALPVPSCPGWDVAQLVRHLGGAHRWATAIVAARAAGPVKSGFGDFPPDDADDDPAALGSWLAKGAWQLAETLREAGLDTPVWTPVPGGNTDFYARRFTHETLIHRADATLALGADFTADTDLALDAIDEWMELGSLRTHFEVDPSMLALLGPGRTLHFHATDTAPEASAEWVVDLTGDGLADILPVLEYGELPGLAGAQVTVTWWSTMPSKRYSRVLNGTVAGWVAPVTSVARVRSV